MFYTYNQENTENFILGPKPPGPNRERAEPEKGRNLWHSLGLGHRYCSIHGGISKYDVLAIPSNLALINCKKGNTGRSRELH